MKISKIVLGLVLSVMIISSIGLVFINKDESNIVDIYGKRESLGDVSIAYQDRQGYYKTKEVVVDKEKLDVDEFAKEIPTAYPNSSFIKEHRDLLLFKNAYKTELYQDDTSLGYIDLVEDYSLITEENEKIQYFAYIHEKDLESGRMNEYRIPLDFYKKYDDSIEYIATPIKYKDKLYIVMAYDINPNYMKNGKKISEIVDDSVFENNENTVYGAKESQISIFKLDTKTESSEHILTESISKDDELTLKTNNVAFTYHDTAYILNNSYMLNDQKKYERKISLLAYNVATRKLENIDLAVDIDNKKNIQLHTIEGNILTLIATDEDKYGRMHFYISKINLDTNEIIKNNEKYELSIDDNNEFFNIGIDDIRILDNKIYLAIGSYENTELTKNIESQDKKYIVVIDEDSKDTLYIGKIEHRTNGYIRPSIATKEDL